MGLVTLGSVCEENTTELKPIYKVVRARTSSYTIQNYSSKIDEWVKSTLVATGSFNLLRLRHPHVFNGVFHWITEGSSLAVYDSNRSEINHLQLINLPSQTLSKNVSRSPSDDVLWFGINNKTDGLQFWRLPKNGRGYNVNAKYNGLVWISFLVILQYSMVVIHNCY